MEASNHTLSEELFGNTLRLGLSFLTFYFLQVLPSLGYDYVVDMVVIVIFSAF